MADPTTPRTRMTHGCLRRIGVIGLADTFYTDLKNVYYATEPA